MPDMPDMEFPPGVPEDIQEFVKTQVDRHEMSVNVHRHELIRFFAELTSDQAHQLAAILSMLEDNPERASYFLGYLQATLQYRFNECSACGENHEEQLLGISEP